MTHASFVRATFKGSDGNELAAVNSSSETEACLV